VDFARSAGLAALGAIGPLRREVREGLVTFLQRSYPAALPSSLEPPSSLRANNSEP